MTSLTKNPHSPSKKFFFECRLEDFPPRLLRLLPRLESIADRRNSHAKPRAFKHFFSDNPRNHPGAKVLKAVSILPTKCRRQRLGWSYCVASPKLGRNEVKTKDKL